MVNAPAFQEFQSPEAGTRSPGPDGPVMNQ